MKKILITLIYFLYLSNPVQSQEFYPNKEITIKDLINFDLNRYNFSDYKKIIGNNVRSWDGDKNKINIYSKDWKEIDVKIDGSTYSLRLSHLKNDQIGLLIILDDLTCQSSKAFFPKEYINKENTLNYTADYSFTKIYLDKFSFDTPQKTRLKYSCLQAVDNDNLVKADGIRSTSIRLTSTIDPNNPHIIPLKMIRCKLTKGRTLNATNYDDLKEPQYGNYYISDGEEKLLDEYFLGTGKKIQFDNDKIHTKEEYELDRTKTNRKTVHKEIIIDRFNGDIYYKKKIYDKEYNFKETPDNIVTIEWKGSCKKKNIEERAF